MDISRSGTGERYSSKHRECGHTPQNGQIRPPAGPCPFCLLGKSQTLMKNGNGNHRNNADAAMYFRQGNPEKPASKHRNKRMAEVRGQA